MKTQNITNLYSLMLDSLGFDNVIEDINLKYEFNEELYCLIFIQDENRKIDLQLRYDFTTIDIVQFIEDAGYDIDKHEQLSFFFLYEKDFTSDFCITNYHNFKIDTP